MTIYNEEPTFFKYNVEPSVIDHVWGNCTRRISHLATDYHFLSPDHKYLQVFISLKLNTPAHQFIRTRDWRKVNKNDLQMAVELNPELNHVFTLTDPEAVADIIMTQLNNILNNFAK